MRKSYILIALAMVAALSMVSCKNNKKAKEPTQEEVQEMKQALVDSVLAQIDAFADKYIIASDNSFDFVFFELTEKEKQIKPDYLLDPSEVTSFVTKSQKVNALAYYIVDWGIRKLYDMPVEEAKETIVKLALDTNFPFDIDAYEANIPISEFMKNEYEKCKDNGDLTYFWQYHNALLIEIGYIIAQNPELFFSRISEEQWQYYCQSWGSVFATIHTLAKYDEEMASLLEFTKKYFPFSSVEEEGEKDFSSKVAKQYRIDNKDKFVTRRNALLQ